MRPGLSPCRRRSRLPVLVFQSLLCRDPLLFPQSGLAGPCHIHVPHRHAPCEPLYSPRQTNNKSGPPRFALGSFCFPGVPFQRLGCPSYPVLQAFYSERTQALKASDFPVFCAGGLAELLFQGSAASFSARLLLL